MVSAAALDAFLRRNRRIGLDSNLLIYFLEADPVFHPLCRRVFDAIESGRNQAICSTLSLLETLVQPYRQEDDAMANQFYGLLTTYPHLNWIALSAEIADRAAQIRARYRLKTPDAIVVATALHAQASGFIGNDLAFERIEEMDVLTLSRQS